MAKLRRQDLDELDRQDALAPLRASFHLPRGLVYLDGNSLGPLPRAARQRLRRVVDLEWGRDLIGSWNRHGWIDLPLVVGEKIGRLLGAGPGETAVADSTSVNVFKLAAAALALSPGRRTIVALASDFPSDLYVLAGLAELLRDGSDGRPVKVELVAPDDVGSALGPDTALLVASHVDFRTGRLHDLAALSRLAHQHGALVLFDLAHSAGVVPLELARWQVDLAVGCGYKYLNGGPGAPAFLYVASRHQDALRQPLSGWMGHAAPFRFEPTYEPAPGIGRTLCGTPPILSLAALDAALEVFDGVDVGALRAKSMALGEVFLRLVGERCGDAGLELASPANAVDRGSQISLRHARGYGIVQALAARGVVGDFRAPDLLRFGFAPTFLRFRDLWTAALALERVLEREEWDRAEHRRQLKVT